MEIKENLKLGFVNSYGHNPDGYYTCGGRFEILGNHTDHNHGLCLAATCDLAISSAVSKRNDNIVKLVSEGNPSFEISLDSLEVKEEEKSTSQGLIRGVASYFVEHGYKVGGFEVYMTSTIFAGAGVSSSAAFELLIAEIFNALFNDGGVPKMLMCKAGQFGENKYFGKASGLLDQIGVAYGNIVSIDFEEIASPKVEQVNFPFKDLHFVIVNTGGSHAALSDLYSAIPLDMHNAAHKIGHNFLREGTMEEIEKSKALLTEMEYLRAKHFYGENERVSTAKKAILANDEKTFLDMINASRYSSTNYLKNMMVRDEYEGSPLQATDYAMEIMNGEGACKINGGGFAGSIICAVPEKHLVNFLKKMGERYGANNTKEVHVPEFGPHAF